MLALYLCETPLTGAPIDAAPRPRIHQYLFGFKRDYVLDVAAQWLIDLGAREVRIKEHRCRLTGGLWLTATVQLGACQVLTGTPEIGYDQRWTQHTHLLAARFRAIADALEAAPTLST